ncbi:hypothetical protein [Nocardia arizonensis]|uniref:hypothetical protein n=1 Tax=Nocardia arizonensis TaxID=1141647 RepID=UPI0006D2C9CA|nr:hypothetical protein [Nocardia arizonensis]
MPSPRLPPRGEGDPHGISAPPNCRDDRDGEPVRRGLAGWAVDTVGLENAAAVVGRDKPYAAEALNAYTRSAMVPLESKAPQANCRYVYRNFPAGFGNGYRIEGRPSYAVRRISPMSSGFGDLHLHGIRATGRCPEIG